MTLYGVYGSHTVEACPLYNAENRKAVISIAPHFKDAVEAAGAKVIAQFHSGLEHTFLWVFDAPDAKVVEELMIQGGAAKFNACTIVPLTSFDQLVDKLKTIENS
jgi:hypothetical protein